MDNAFRGVVFISGSQRGDHGEPDPVDKKESALRGWHLDRAQTMEIEDTFIKTRKAGEVKCRKTEC